VSDLSWLPSEAKETRFIVPKINLSTKEQRCRLSLSFSLYFDGTRNNKFIDKQHGSHSNVARLFELSKQEDLDCIFRLYVQGVGTPFSAIGEAEPHPYGASTGAGGGRLRVDECLAVLS